MHLFTIPNSDITKYINIEEFFQYLIAVRGHTLTSKRIGYLKIMRGVSFAGTLVVLLGALVAATIIAITINKVYGTLATRPLIMTSSTYYIVEDGRIRFNALFYNVGQGNTRFKYLKLYIPLSTDGENKVSIITVYGNTSVFNETTTPTPLVGAVVNFGSRVEYVELIIEEGDPTNTAYTGSEYYITRLRFHMITGEVIEVTLNLTDSYGNTYPAPSIVRYIYYANGTIVQLFTNQSYRQVVQNLTRIPYRAILKPGDIIEIHIDSNEPRFPSNYYDGYIPIQITEYGFIGYYTFDFISNLIMLLYYGGVRTVTISHETNIVFHNLKANTTFDTPSMLTRIRWRRIWISFYISYRSYFVWNGIYNWNGSVKYDAVDYYCLATALYGACFLISTLNYTMDNVWEGYVNPLVKSSGGALYIDVLIPIPPDYKVNAEKILGVAVFDREAVPLLFSRIR